MAVSTAFMIARYIIRSLRHRFFIGEEILISIAWVCMMTVCGLFIAVAPTLFKLSAVSQGHQPPYESLPRDTELCYRIFFANTLLFLTCLWCVKVALLIQCKRLVERQRKYTIIWWSIVAFTIVSYMGCIINTLTPCKSLHKYLTYRTSSSTAPGSGEHYSTDMSKLVANLRQISNARRSPCILLIAWT